MLAELRSELTRVEESESPRVARFDGGTPLRGSLVVLPSAFNPPTRAHFRLLQAAAEALVASPAAMLTTRNVAKDPHGASHEQRIEMLLAAREAVPGLVVLASNQARIIDQAALLAGTYADAEFAMIVGYDTLVRLFDPVYYRDMAAELGRFFGKHRLVATNRAEHGIDEVQAVIAREAGVFADRVTAVEIDDHHAALSSTVARGHAAEGVESHALLPEVSAYIRREGLYRE